MPDLNFRLVITTDGAQQKIKLVKQDAEQLRDSIEEPSDLYVLSNDADGKLRLVKKQAEEAAKEVETPRTVQVNAAASLATLRDLTITVSGITQAFAGLARGVTGFLDAELSQRRALTLATVAFGDAAAEMAGFASEMQKVTNFGDEEMLALFAKLGQTFKLSTDEIQALTPGLLDFTEATAATGMTLESAFDLMGRALAGHTEMLGRHGIELDNDRLAMEGVSYLAEKLAEDYGGTAAALADLRTQNRNAWGDIREDIGAMLAEIFNPLLKAIRALMDGFNSLSPVLKGVVAGLALAIPVIASVATAIVAVTVAITALKTAINPVAGIISLVVGAATAGAVGLGAYSAAAKKAGDDSHTAADGAQSLAAQLEEIGKSVETESAKFSLLSSRLLELRAKTSLANAEKTELKNLIGQINQLYAPYIGNINLETAGYKNLAAALNQAAGAMINKKVAEAYGTLWSKKIDQIVTQTLALQEKFGVDAANKMLADPLKKVIGTVKTGFETMGIKEMTVAELTPMVREVVRLKGELAEIEKMMSDASKYLPKIDYGSGKSSADSFSATVVGDVDNAISEFDRLMAEIEDRTTDAYARLDAEDAARRELIYANTAQDSQQRRDAIAAVDAWYLEELAKLDDASVKAVQTTFKAQVDHFANLAELGVGTYDELKKAMEDYYAWARENLSAEDSAAVLLQLKQANLRWGQAKQERIDREIAHLRELEDLRDEFARRDFDLQGDSLAAALLEVQRYYERKKNALIAAGITEEQIARQQMATQAKILIDHATSARLTLQDLQDDFARREFGLSGDSLAAALLEVQRYYERNRQLLIAAGISETRIIQLQNAETTALKTAHLQNIQDLQDDFARRDFDLQGNGHDAALLEVQRYYEQNKALLIAAGIEEVDLERQKQEAIKKIKLDTMASTSAGLSQIFSNLAAAQDQESERGFKTWKAMAIAQGYVDTFSSAIAAYRAMVGIPGVGPALAVAAAAAALAAGLANISRIAAQKYEKMATGGAIVGPAHTSGGTIIEAEGGEYVIRKDKVRALGQPLFDFLNFAPLTAIRDALATLRLPSLPLPAAMPSFAYASGGPVSQPASFEPLNALLAKLNAKLDALAAPQIHVSVDPLDNHPVKISQLAERGSKIRSTY